MKFVPALCILFLSLPAHADAEHARAARYFALGTVAGQTCLAEGFRIDPAAWRAIVLGAEPLGATFEDFAAEGRFSAEGVLALAAVGTELDALGAGAWCQGLEEWAVQEHILLWSDLISRAPPTAIMPAL